MTVAVPSLNAITGVILAGGLGRRMGGEKAMRMLAGRPLVNHVIDRLAGQLEPGRLMLNINTAAIDLTAYGLSILPDSLDDRPGPLAGLLAAMQAGRPDGWVLSVPTDTPFLPRDLVSRLRQGLADHAADISLAASANGLCQVCGLWPVRLADDLAKSLASGQNKVLTWATRHKVCRIDFPLEQIGLRHADPFFNINTPEDLAEAERLISGANT